MASNVVPAILTEVRAALPNIPGGTRRKTVDGSVPTPSFWLHSDSATTTNTIQDTAILALDIWESDRDKLDAALEALEPLRKYMIGGNTYNRESVSILHEEEGVLHGTLIWSVVHFAGALSG